MLLPVNYTEQSFIISSSEEAIVVNFFQQKTPLIIANNKSINYVWSHQGQKLRLSYKDFSSSINTSELI
jgi:hypothetical protein